MWLPIPGYPDYDVSDSGQVRSRKSGTARVMKLRLTNRGYYLVRLYCKREWKDHTVHSLVLLTFVGERPEGLCIRHLDSDPTNNSLSNLKYGSLIENQRDRLEDGTYGMKLTARHVRIIRGLHKIGFTHRRLAKLFGINRHNIGRIIRRQHWANLN